jgi:hypothetical protein
MGKHLSDSFSKKNGLNQVDALSPLLYYVGLEYVTRKVGENQVGPEINATHQLLPHSDDVNLLGYIVKKNRKVN